MSFVGYDHLGWLVCDGRALSKAQYNLLFQVLGYTFGGSGDSFNLPDPQGRVLGSVGNPGGATGTDHPPGESTGTETETLTIAEMHAHNHGTQTATAQPARLRELTSNSATGVSTQSAGDHTHTSNATAGAPGAGLAFRDGNNTRTAADSGQVNELNLDTMVALTINNAGAHTHGITDPTHNHTLAPVGGGQAHNNIQPTLFIGNTFIYSGIPTAPGFPPNPASAWPFTVGLNPPLI
jgi:microcystin-dependent protein